MGYYRRALGPPLLVPDVGRGWASGPFELAMTAQDLALWDASMLGEKVLSPVVEAARSKISIVRDSSGVLRSL